MDNLRRDIELVTKNPVKARRKLKEDERI